MANVISTDEFIARVASIVHLSVFDLQAAVLTAHEAITLVSDDTGSITISDSTMQFADANGDVRVQIGLNGQDEYSLDIFSPADLSYAGMGITSCTYITIRCPPETVQSTDNKEVTS